MSIKPPFTQLDIRTAPSGFYAGYSIPIALVSKVGMTLLVIWALVWPGNANSVLSAVNGTLLNGFNAFYIIAVGRFSRFSCSLWPCCRQPEKKFWVSLV